MAKNSLIEGVTLSEGFRFEITPLDEEERSNIVTALKFETLKSLKTDFFENFDRNIEKVASFFEKEERIPVKILLKSLFNAGLTSRKEADIFLAVDSFLTLYKNSPSPQSILSLCRLYPDEFILPYHPMSLLCQLKELTKENQLQKKCLEVIVEKKMKPDLIHTWIDCIKDSVRVPEAYFLHKMKKLELSGIPKEWIDDTLDRLPFLRGVRISDDTLDLHLESASFLDLYYTEMTKEIYDSKMCETRFPLQECIPFATDHIVRKETFSKECHYGDQVAYGAFVHQTILTGAAFLKEKGWGFNELLAFLMIRRNKIGSQNSRDAHFGLPLGLNKSMYTHCFSVYKKLGEALLELLHETPFLEKIGENRYQIKNLLKGEEIRHTSILFNRSNQGTEVFIYHLESEEVRGKILKEVHSLFDEARIEKDHDLFLKKIGLIYWWICQAKPWYRGDPSIAEMLIKVLCVEKGLKLTPWKVGVVPWEEVMKEFDPDKFAENFHTHFE
jgi:hypothetical protein